MQEILTKIVKKYTSLNEPVKASLWFMICSIIQKGISILCTPVFTRLMTQEQYGNYTIYISWHQIIMILTSLNLSAGVYNNALTFKYNNAKQITSTFLGLSNVVTIGGFILYISNKNFWNLLTGLSTEYICIMFCEVLFTSAYSLWSAKERYDYKYKGIICTCFIIGIGGPLLAVYSVFYAVDKSIAIILSFALVQILVGFFLTLKIYLDGKKFYDKRYWIFALKFNLPLIPHYLSQIILNQADRIMINRYIGVEEAAMYGVAYTISQMMMIVVASINSTLTPFLYQSIKKSNYDEIRNVTAILTIMISAGCILAIMIGPDLMRILATNEYYSAVYIIPPVAASLYFIFVQGLCATVEFYFEETKFIMLASIFAAVANIGMNFFVLNRWGYIAAGYTTLVCYILLFIAHYICYKVIKKKNNIYRTIYSKKIILFCGFILLLAVLVTIYIYQWNFIRWGICGGIFVLLVYNKKIFIKYYILLKK